MMDIKIQKACDNCGTKVDLDASASDWDMSQTFDIPGLGNLSVTLCPVCAKLPINQDLRDKIIAGFVKGFLELTATTQRLFEQAFHDRQSRIQWTVLAGSLQAEIHNLAEELELLAFHHDPDNCVCGQTDDALCKECPHEMRCQEYFCSACCGCNESEG